eukprot:173106_1
MSWAQLTNRPTNVSPAFGNNHHHHHTPNIGNPNPYSNHISTTNNVYSVPPPKVSTTSSKHKHNEVQCVVLDAGALIGRQSFFNNFSESARYYMTPAVHHEIRDKQSRKFLEKFPYEIIVKKPESQSLQFVSQFIGKHPTLKSMSKVDRHIIALAHSLEIECEGTKHVSTFKKKQKKSNNATSTNTDKRKKSKTGRIHTQLTPLSDTGVRLAKLKKVIPFHFDEFMTMTKQQYAQKYGKPIQSVSHPATKTESKVKVNPNVNVRANSECAAANDETNPISKAQRRRKRKKTNKNKTLPEDTAGDKSEIEKMIEEDLKNTFNETASLISSLSTRSTPTMATQSEAHSMPILSPATHNNAAPPVPFGTMFNGAHGSLFSGKEAPAAKKKKTIADAWEGEWLTPDNFRAIPKNAAKSKKKLKHSAQSSNTSSSVAVITVDKAMQRCMVEMGLRVMTTTAERQYGGAQAGHNGEPIDYMFRCYGCFQFEHNTTRTNCRWCGGQTFQRVAIYEDDKGKHHYRYYYRDRYAHRYLDKHQLVPRGSQLVKYQQNQHNANHINPHRNQRKKKKKRGAIYNQNQYRKGHAQRW